MPSEITPPTSEISIDSLKKSTAPVPEGLLAAALSGATGNPAPDKPAEQPASSPAPKSQDKPATPPEKKDEPKPEPVKKQGVDAVRDALERAQANIKELTASDSLSKKAKADAESQIAKLQADLDARQKEIENDLKPRAQKLSEIEKKLQEKEELLRVKDFTATQEWHDKYNKPIAEAEANVTRMLTELEVSDGAGGMRTATPKDFLVVLGAPTITQAARMAKEIFGDDIGPTILAERNKMRELGARREEAGKNAAKEAIEYEARNQSAIAQRRDEFRQKLLSSRRSIEEQSPDIFKPSEDDNDWKQALEEGEALIHRIDEGKLSPDEQISEIAKARTSIKATPVLKLKVKTQAARIAELEEQLKQYQNSEPGVTTRNAGDVTAPSSDRDAAKSGLLAAAQRLAMSRG